LGGDQPADPRRDPTRSLCLEKVELAIIVDGQDIIGQVFDRGPREDPDQLLGPTSPLLPSTHPHEVRLAEAICTEACHVALYTRIRRNDSEIVWDRWRNPDSTGSPLACSDSTRSNTKPKLPAPTTTVAGNGQDAQWPGCCAKPSTRSPP